MPPEMYAVIGDPIDHSLSPVMHAAAFKAAGLPHRYHAMRVPPAQLRGAVDDLRAREYGGFNVTIPHKQSIIPLLDAIEPFARSVGAVNTVTRRNGLLIGHNTDVPGFLSALAQLYSPETGDHVVVLGTGGAARAVVHALSTLPVSITVISRRPDRTFAPLVQPNVVAMAEAGADLERARVLVNATPAGMPPLEDLLPVPADVRLTPDTVVIDLVYGRTTPLLDFARQAGCTCADGMEMLVQQGAAAFRLWTGVNPNVDVMRRACMAALGKAEECFVS